MPDQPREPNRLTKRPDGQWEVECGEWVRGHWYPQYAKVHADPMVVIYDLAKDVKTGKTQSIGVTIPMEAIADIERFEEAGVEKIIAKAKAEATSWEDGYTEVARQAGRIPPKPPREPDDVHPK